MSQRPWTRVLQRVRSDTKTSSKLAAPWIVHTVVEKKLNMLRVCLVKGNEQRGIRRSQPSVKGWPNKDGNLEFFVVLFPDFYRPVLPKADELFSSSQRFFSRQDEALL